MGPASRGQAALAGIRKTLDVGLAIPQIAASEPERPCAAALSLEDWRTERNSGQRSYDRLLEAPGVSDAADAVGSLQRASDGPFGGRYLGRLAHLDLPDEISPGTGLILPQNHGTPPPEARIAATARSAGWNSSSLLEPAIEEDPNFQPSARRALAAIRERAKATQPGG